MKCDVFSFEAWDHLCEQAKSHLGLASTPCQVKLYKGLSHALFEVSLGLCAMYPHKQGVAYFKDVSPYFGPLMMQLSRAGYQVHAAQTSVFQEPKKWAEEILKDSVFALWTDDDPVTAHLYNADLLTEQFQAKRIFQLKTSHSSWHRWLPQTVPGPYDVWFLSIAPDLCVAVLGEKARFVDAGVASLSWLPHHLDKLMAASFEENEERVKAFEADSRANFKPLLHGEARLYDRAVLYWPDIDGYAAISEIARRLKITLNDPGENDVLETTSLCRWQTLRGLHWLSAQGYSDEMIRGLLIIDQKRLDEELMQTLLETRAHLLKLQDGT